MKLLLIGILAFISVSVFAGDCTLLLLRNGTPMVPVAGRANLGKCIKGAALLLQNNKELNNPTVYVHHNDLENGVYLRLKDGNVVN